MPALLLIALVGFLPPSDPRIRSTVEADRARALQEMASSFATTRTRRDDGLNGREGAFLACSFWYADNLSCLDGIRRQRSCSSSFCRCATTSGLLAEEYDTRAARMVGNFPQAFSHVALVNTAHNLGAASETGGAALRQQAATRRGR